MKERFNIEIADIKFSILSDDGEEFITQTVSAVDKCLQTYFAGGKHFSKLDAAILCALDFCGEKQKADRKIKSLEAQVEILEANLHRLREEAESKEVTETNEAPLAETVEEASENEAVHDITHETETEEASTEETSAENKEEKPATDEEKGTESSSRDQKFRQLEALLGGQLKLDLGKE